MKLPFLPPMVTVLNEERNQLVTILVTKCDNCGKTLKNSDYFIDDAVRPLYFCSEKCRKPFTKMKFFPNIKLSVLGTQ